MNKLLRHIHEHSVDSLHSGLIVGAGNGSQLSDWRQLGCRHLLLAEAHPGQAEELGRRLRHEQGELLLALAVTADEQPMATLQPLNNLAYSSLNTAIDLFAHYPNLRSGEALQVPASSLGQLLAEQDLDEQQPHLLLIAAPGQAMQLLQGTPAAVLQVFTWLLIECSSEPLYQGDAGASDISTWLQGLGYDLVSDDPDAIYPQSQLLFKRNPSAVERLRLSREVAELRSQQVQAAQSSQKKIAALQQQLQQCDATLVEQTRLANERKTQIDTLAKEHAELTAAHDELGKDKIALGVARDEQTKLASERQAQIDTLGKEKADLATARDALAKEKSELIKARDEQVKLASERQAKIDALTSEKTTLIAANDVLKKDKAALTAARDEQTKLANERMAQLDALTSEKTALITANDVLNKDKTALTAARDEQTKLANERKAQLDALTSEKTELITANDVLNQNKAALTAARDEQIRLAEERKAQLEKVTSERDQVQKAAAEQKKNLDATQQKLMTQQQEIKQQEVETNESNLRQQLMQQELIKAEAQIELIKDLLLREPGL